MNKIDKLINLFIERISFNLYKPDKNKKVKRMIVKEQYISL